MGLLFFAMNLVTLLSKVGGNSPFQTDTDILAVGEEYDGGFAYYGVNSARDKLPFKWAHWLSQSPESAGSMPRIERSASPLQSYPWQLLNRTSPYFVAFNSSGTYSKHLVRFSLSGAPRASDLLVELDGKDLSWAPREDVGVDRWHYDIMVNSALTEGEHELRFTVGLTAQEGLLQLCSFEIIEYGSDSECVYITLLIAPSLIFFSRFDMTPGTIGAYPTYILSIGVLLLPSDLLLIGSPCGIPQHIARRMKAASCAKSYIPTSVPCASKDSGCTSSSELISLTIYLSPVRPHPINPSRSAWNYCTLRISGSQKRSNWEAKRAIPYSGSTMALL